MQALIVYESMFGDTHMIAEAVADGLSQHMHVRTQDVGTLPEVTLPELTGVDLLVVGAPTHAFGLSRPSTRQSAVQQGATHASADVGLREWLARSTFPRGMAVATFDTRINRPRVPGSAARKAA